MTEKQIKKAVELAKGFELIEEGSAFEHVRYGIAWFKIDNIREWEHYPLLLYRAMEGWNSSFKPYVTENRIVIKQDKVLLETPDDLLFFWLANYNLTPYLTAQEQALEAALEEVL